ncbi:MAG: RDD family protein [Bacteroidota bacterium]
MELAHDVLLSSRKRRLIAFFIDHVIIMILIISTAFLIIGPHFLDENEMDNKPLSIILVLVIGLLLYFAKDSIKGMSIGKWIMGIMVRDADHPTQVPSLGRLLIRNLPIIVWPIEFAILASNESKKRFGDRLANTIVIHHQNKPAILPRIAALVLLGLAFFTSTIFFVGASMKNSGAYKMATAAIEQNQDIINQTGGIKGYGIIPAGKVSVSKGQGEAQLTIQVLGNEKNVTVNVYLTKAPEGNWELIELR